VGSIITSDNVQTPSISNTMLTQWHEDYRARGGFFLQDMKYHIFQNDCKNISHNIMQGRLLPTMREMKKVDPHRIQKLAINAM